MTPKLTPEIDPKWDPQRLTKSTKWPPMWCPKSNPEMAPPWEVKKWDFAVIYYTLERSKLSEKTQIWSHFRVLFGPHVAQGRVFRGTLKISRKIDPFWLPFWGPLGHSKWDIGPIWAPLGSPLDCQLAMIAPNATSWPPKCIIRAWRSLKIYGKLLKITPNWGVLL